ncbi:MAG: hypothetical protein P8Y63_05910 [Deltaproteobacteria bacterium]
MVQEAPARTLYEKYITQGNHAASDYFGLIRELVARRKRAGADREEHSRWQREIDAAYALVGDELLSNKGRPLSPVKFGTSGWRGILGKDLFAKSVAQVALAIIVMYRELSSSAELAPFLGVRSLREAQERGCVVGFDKPHPQSQSSRILGLQV